MSAADDEFPGVRRADTVGIPEGIHFGACRICSKERSLNADERCFECYHSVEPIGALALDLDAGRMRWLQALADEGLLGGTAEEVASYLITRGLDDLTRAGALPLVISAAPMIESAHG